MSRVVTSSGTIDYGLVWGWDGAKVKDKKSIEKDKKEA
jgi:hypothetical protein